MRAHEYLNAHKTDIIFNSTKENNLTKEQANSVFIRIEEIIRLLNPLRLKKYPTRNLLEEKLMTTMGYRSIEDSLVENWLWKIVSVDDTFIYAYNYLTQLENKKMSPLEYPLKEQDKESLYERLVNESKEEVDKKTLEKNESKRIRVKVIALIHVYEYSQITRDNADEIAKKYGYVARTSGEGLFQDFTYYSSLSNRKGKPNPCTPKKLNNKIALIESVIEHLSDKAKQRALDEIKMLKMLYKNEYQ